jgi:hypothetical protein
MGACAFSGPPAVLLLGVRYRIAGRLMHEQSWTHLGATVGLIERRERKLSILNLRMTAKVLRVLLVELVDGLS